MSFPTPRRLGLVLIAGLILLSACSSSDALEGKVVADGAGCSPTQVERTTPAPTITPAKKEPTKVVKKDLVKGKGCVVSGTGFTTLDMVGATAVGGTQFVDTYGKTFPITARLGTGQLLSGLESGLAGMKVGGRRQITVPAKDAYGKDGNEAQKIGPGEGLTFIVDVVAATDKPVYCNEATIPPTTENPGKPTSVDMPLKAPTGKTTTKVLEKGTGPKVTAKSYVTVDYLGVACSTGKQFDSSFDRGEAFQAALSGTGNTQSAVIPGWTSGLVGQTAGSLVQLNIPASEAYGATGQGADIGPNEALVFVIRILSTSTEAPVNPLDALTTIPSDGGSTTTAAKDAEATPTTAAKDAEAPTTTEP